MVQVSDRADSNPPEARGDVAGIVAAELWDPRGRPASWQRWRRDLPALLHAVLAEWDLRPDGYRGVGECAIVLGVHTPDGERAALKVGWPHPESAHEHIALRLWAGDGAVRLLRADPARGALLLERAGPEDLTSVDPLAACEIIARLYPRLHRPATAQLTRLSDLSARWSRELAALPADAPVPHRLVSQAAALAADFATDRATDGRLLHSDLHYFNVLAADREPWLVIDPKPLSGDPSFEVAPLLWNRWDEVLATGTIREAVRARMTAATDAAGFDPQRARDWVIVRELVNVMWTLHDAPTVGPSERQWITRSVTIAKAVQD
ncbi:MAG: aminoglycoside resistance protein [Actinobacteria bacterium]|jgi:streptomycin 6-kinase|nr:aminoglycoside resistance protein [Actinomycetota bacterium]